MQSSGIFENSYDYYCKGLKEIAEQIASEDPRLADACIYGSELIQLLKSLDMDLPSRIKFEWEKSRIRFEWVQSDESLVVFLVSDEEIRSLVYKENNTIVEINTVQRGSLSEDSLYKRDLDV
jgi:hypothetical protein